MQRTFFLRVLCALVIGLLVFPLSVFGEEAASTRWADAADEIDKYLDAAFEAYLDGDPAAAYDNVSNAYFRVYETTGFERQTMSYISGNRKNAVEMQFSACKAAVKKENQTNETKTSVRSALTKLKAMIREDGNKLAAMQGGVQSETKYYLRGEPAAADPYAEYSADPNAAAKFATWYEAATLVKELLDTAYMAYLDKDFDAAADNLNTAYYAVYEESGLDHAIYTELSAKERQSAEKCFSDLRGLLASGGEKYQKNKYRTTTDRAKNTILKYAKAIDTKHGEAKAAEAAESAPAAEEAPAEEKQSDPKLLTFLGAFGIIVREGLEAILVIAAIIAYLVKSGNSRSVRNVYIGAVAGVAASFAAAAVLAWAKQAFVGAGLAQEVIEGITALIAVCVLFYVSNWMISKAEAANWSRFIDGKVQSSVEQGSAFALAFTAFLSVFREGAEVVLFYQPMLSEGNPGMVWAGFGAGCVLLVFVYLAITKLSIKLPIKVFFTATSILMAVMCVSFLGSGIKELAEGNVFDLTLRVPGIPENDVIQIFGIYPWLETLVPQLILSIILLITFMMAHYRGKINALKAQLANPDTLTAHPHAVPDIQKEFTQGGTPRMKKIFALLLAAMMLFAVSAVSLAEEEAGFDEYELGVEGEQDVDFMTMAMVYFQPVDMAPAENATPKEGSDLHIEVDLTAKENPYGFPVDGWVPYLSIDFVIKDLEGKEVYSGSMMPMAASDGPHYGNNIPLAEGEYTITLYIKSPAENGYLLHVDAETGVEAKDGFWTEPLTATWTGWKFVKEW